MIHLGINFNDRNTSLRVSSKNRVLNRGRAAPSRQERWVDIERAVSRDIQDCLRDDFAVRGYDIKIRRRRFAREVRGIKFIRLEYGYAVPRGA